MLSVLEKILVKKQIYIYLKSLIYLAVFSILHFGYDLTKLDFLKPFCGVNESVFQHLKMAFWAYIFIGLIETLSKKKEILVSRLFSAIIIPWITLIVWYLPFIIIYKFSITLFEVIWSIIATYFSAVITFIIESDIQSATISKKSKTIIYTLAFISAFLFVVYTYKLPYIDLFINPENLPK